MEEKCTFDLVTLLRAQKPITCNITYRGVDNSFGVYQHALTSYFSQNALVWKRNGKAFPYRLTIPLKFVTFEEALCWKADLDSEELVGLAYLHVFFICSSSVEEYRSSVRHNVSEWFSMVSSKPDVQWLIVIDSTRAKEKKSRNSLMEKLKSDFSKHTSRLIEVSESVEHGSFIALAQAVQTALLSHLDLVVNSWEIEMGKSKDSCHEKSWDLQKFFVSTTEHARFFWSLGALEHALTIYDDLDRFLSTITHFNHSNGVPEWLLLMRSSELSECPAISSTMTKTVFGIREKFSLLDVRHFLLTQQVLLCLHLNHSRARSRGAAPSLRSDFAGLILKYTHHAHQTIKEHSLILELPEDEKKFACYTILLIGESLHISGLLAGSASIEEAASPSLCQLHISRFNAVHSLDYEIPDERLIEWLKESKLQDNFLIEVLQNKALYSVQFQKIHDITNSILTQCGRKRTCAYIGGVFSQWLRKETRSDAALPYHLRFVNEVIENGCCSPKALEEIKSVSKLLNPEHDFSRILSFSLFICFNAEDDSMKLDYARQFLELLATRQYGRLNLSSLTPYSNALFKCALKSFPSNIQLPNGVFEIDIEVENLLPCDIEDCEITIQVREIDSGLLSRRKRPVFQQNFSTRDSATRILAVHRGHAFDRPVPPSPSAASIELNEKTALKNGLNRCFLSAPALVKGCYVLENVRISLVSASVVVDFPADHFENINPLICFVQSSPNSLSVADAKDLLAGVVQSIDVIIQSGSMMETSEVTVTASEDASVEFLTENGEWKKLLSVPVPVLATDQKHRFTVQLCVPMDSAMTESPAVRKFSFEWMGRTWTYDLSFVALLILSSKTTILEDKMLYELEVARALADEWTVIFESAILSVEDNDSDAPKHAELLNTELDGLIPNIVSSLVWNLPVKSESPLLHKLDIKYKVKPSKNDDVDYSEHLYSYISEFHLKVPQVGYELCTQMLSHQPGAQLCRAGSPCDLVVSLRSLYHSVEMLYIVLDADANLWTLNERAKILQVKESGLGQMAFSVIPCAAGFLPYPSVSVYSCINIGGRNLEAGWTEGVDIVPGSPLISFQRTAGKQIRVLAASLTDSQTTERKAGFKQKIVKLFD
ncbi:unnamed protein product [Auanema sp. JU1783]|nr:unnamed protein product [Auanema sp. JU1783]